MSTGTDTPVAPPDRTKPTLAVPDLQKVISATGEVTGQKDRGGQAGVYRYTGPRFRVSGTVLLQVAQPFDPAPTLPRTNDQGQPIVQDGQERLFGTASIGGEYGYRYPEDSLPDVISIESSRR